MQHRDLAKALVLSLLLITVVALRWIIIPEESAGTIIVASGYFFLAVNFLFFTYFSLKLLVSIRGKQAIGKHLSGLLICLALTCLTHLVEPHRFKVLNDEFALLNNSMAMHHYQKAGLMGQAVIVDGDLIHPSFTADKRSLFFQYLLSVMHSISGYRPANAFVLNFLLTGAFFFALYGFLNLLLKSRYLAIIGIILMASVPLFSQISTSGGYDLLNITLLLIFMCLGAAYLRNGTNTEQGALVTTCLLLAQTRYESLLYLFSLGAIVSLVWIRKRKLELSWVSVISPVFLFIPLMANAHMFAHEALQDGAVRGGDVEFMSMSHLAANLKDAAIYFSLPSLGSTSSVMVSLLGAAGLSCLPFLLLANRRNFQGMDRPAEIAYLAVLPVTLFCFILTTTNFWGRLTDPMASRFAIPLYLMAMLAGLICLKFFLLKRPKLKIVVSAYVALSLLVGFSKSMMAEKTRPLTRSQYHQWILEFAEDKGEAPILFTCDGILGLVAIEKAALPIEVLNSSPEEIAKLMATGDYDSIYAFDLSLRDSNTGLWYFAPGSTGYDPKKYAAEVEAERFFGSDFRARAYRLQGILAP